MPPPKHYFEAPFFTPTLPLSLGQDSSCLMALPFVALRLPGFRDGRNASHQFSIGGRYIMDGAPLLRLENKFDESSDYRASRPGSFEFSIGYRFRFGFRNLFVVGVQINKDVAYHYGRYFAFSLSLPLYKFLSLKSVTGVGSLEHNRYLYGAAAKSGLAHEGLTLQYVIPKLPWQGIIMFEFGRHWVLQKANQQADLVRGNHQQSLAATRWIWSF